MLQRFAGLLLAVLLLASVAGCARDPFACCDRRASLADWFDMYGPTGCYCSDGHCNNSQRVDGCCPNGNCANGGCSCR